MKSMFTVSIGSSRSTLHLILVSLFGLETASGINISKADKEFFQDAECVKSMIKKIILKRKSEPA
jgi:hypothetical protein